LGSFIEWGGSSFKLVIGAYGGGKTHFLYCVRTLAWDRKYVVSYVPLSPGECPFSRFELVYKSIVANLTYPLTFETPPRHFDKGIDAFVRHWFMEKRGEFKDDQTLQAYIKSICSIESSSFANATRAAFFALMEDSGDYEYIIQYLKGEDVTKEIRNKYSINERLDKTTAFRFIRSLTQWIREIGYSGLILLFDEAERGLSIASSREKRIVLDNLRQLVDECGNSRLPSCMVFYAVPDERQLLEEKLEAYEALRQRLSGSLSKVNPSGVRIELEKLQIDPVIFLKELGEKLSKIYTISYPSAHFDREKLNQTIFSIAQEAYQQRYADVSYRRIFVKSIIRAFHILKDEPETSISRSYAQRIIKDELTTIHQQAVLKSEEEEY
jgi:hypothetical protein